MRQLAGLVGKRLVLLDVLEVKGRCHFDISGRILGLMVRVCKQAGGETGGFSLIRLIEGHVVEVNY